MKSKRLIPVFILVVGFATLTIFHVYNYYAPPQPRDPYQLSGQDDDTIRIAYIGDSWAFMHKDHDCLIPKLLSDTLHHSVKIHSYGICGLTSKEIYKNIFDNPDFRHFLQKRHYQYCIISAGINDTYKKMGTSYYQQSMDGIIQFFLANHINPIILEIPDYDIEKCFERQKSSKRLLRQLSMLVNQIPVDCKQQFRDALNKYIKEKGYTDKVTTIKYKSWNKYYAVDQKELYLSDGLHLNKKGYEVLDSAIATQLLKFNNCK